MSEKHRLLAPSKPIRTPPEPPGGSRQVVAKRRPVSIACDVCRKHKARCDGQRPTCSRCRTRGIICVYQADDSRLARVESLKAQRDAFGEENARLWQLFKGLKELPRQEADEILTRLRSTGDPYAALRLARNVSPPMAAGPSFASQEEGQGNTRLPAIDMRALANSPLRVSARPWTLVAGDGVVSDLVSSFFRWDDIFFFPFIDKEAFLDDMRSNDPSRAKYCSPFLVNAICASRSFTSRVVKAYSNISGDDLGVRFLNEAKKMWSQENHRASLPTVQALAIMFTVSAYRGADRQGMAYRIAAYEMLGRLDLPSSFRQADGDTDHGRRTKAIISKALWGLFCFESIVGYVYFQQSLIPPPTIPRCFDDLTVVDPTHNSPGSSPGSTPPTDPGTIAGVLNVTCDLSLLQYQIMSYNAKQEDIGSDEDLAARRQYYNDIQNLWQNIPEHLKEENNLIPQTCFLRMYVDEVIISIWRSVHADTVIQSGRRATAHDLLTHCAITDATVSRRYIDTFGLAEYTCMVLCGLYNAVLLLVEKLGDPTVHDVFTQVCAMIRRTAPDFPMASFILQGVMAMAWSLEMAIPARALPYLQGSSAGKNALRDIPLSFAIPETVLVRSLLSNAGGDTEDLSEMGRLLSKWSELTIE